MIAKNKVPTLILFVIFSALLIYAVFVMPVPSSLTTLLEKTLAKSFEKPRALSLYTDNFVTFPDPNTRQRSLGYGKYMEIFNARLTQETLNSALIEFDYQYTPHPKITSPMIGGDLYFKGESGRVSGYRPSALSPGKHSSRTEVILPETSSIHVFQSDMLLLKIYDAGSSTYYVYPVALNKTYCTNKISIYEYLRHCRNR